jgi:hypothetical protein
MSDELPTFHWSDNAQRILNGTYKPPAEVSEEMRLFIHKTCSSQMALLQQTSILPSPQKTYVAR